jgi:hypothetical protein
VILSNAALDLALHDILPSAGSIILFKETYLYNFRRSHKYFNSRLYSNSNSKLLSSEYIQQYFVGLLDGAGCITVDKQFKTLRIRIFISLQNLQENVTMLTLIRDTIGGRVVIERKNAYVVWIASNKSDLIKIFAILSRYPLLTTRKLSQLQFVKNCLIKPDIENFIMNRNNKYLAQDKIINNIPPFYFKAWLSGFIEAEGNFSVLKLPNGKIRKHAFSIGQNTDKFILEMIKSYFHSQHKITEEFNKAGTFKNYRISIYGSNSRQIIINHFFNKPLFGYKTVSFEIWKNAYSNT